MQESMETNNYKDVKVIHFYHVYIFYALASLTRIPTLLSRLSAGLAIGASMHGAIAYGFDNLFV